jgi:hypothetical protein
VIHHSAGRRVRRVRRVRRIVAPTVLWSGWLVLAGTVMAASPSPTGGSGGDPRSSGQGPGLVGDPLVAIGTVVAIGLAALILTLVYLRATSARRG